MLDAEYRDAVRGGNVELALTLSIRARAEEHIVEQSEALRKTYAQQEGKVVWYSNPFAIPPCQCDGALRDVLIGCIQAYVCPNLPGDIMRCDACGTFVLVAYHAQNLRDHITLNYYDSDAARTIRHYRESDFRISSWAAYNRGQARGDTFKLLRFLRRTQEQRDLLQEFLEDKPSRIRANANSGRPLYWDSTLNVPVSNTTPGLLPYGD